MDSETTQELFGLRNHSQVTVDGKGCCVYLSVQKHTFQRVTLKLKCRSDITCSVMTSVSYILLKYDALFHISLFSISLS